MAIQFVSFDDERLEPGKFYEVRVNKDLASAVIEAPPSPVMFDGSTYITIPLKTHHSPEIWRVERFGEHEKHENITGRVQWFIMQPENQLVIMSGEPITGYVKFI
jgi:hypothetical protein